MQECQARRGCTGEKARWLEAGRANRRPNECRSKSRLRLWRISGQGPRSKVPEVSQQSQDPRGLNADAGYPTALRMRRERTQETQET